MDLGNKLSSGDGEAAVSAVFAAVSLFLLCTEDEVEEVRWGGSCQGE